MAEPQAGVRFQGGVTMSDDVLTLADHELLTTLHRLPDAFDISWLLRMRVVGIEVTQAIQYYQAASHLTDAADRGPDNSVTLIAGKPAWVRVYVRGGLLGGDIPGVTATADVRRRVFGFLYGFPIPLAAQPPGSTVARRFVPYAAERGTLATTLNFIIPADLMCGHLRLHVRAITPGGQTDERTIDLDVTLQQTLRLAGVMVGYNGPSSLAAGAPNLVLAAPTLADLQTTSAWTLLTFPVRSFATYRSAGTVTWNRPLTDAPSCSGCCTPNWVALNAAVQAVRVADGNRTDVLYYGIMAGGIPMGPIIGCNSGGVSTGSNGNQVTMAHELGHACGLPHAPCGTPGDPNYPAYEPYDPANTPQASIGEYGLDISNGNIFSPATFKDMMSYCGPRWISLYNYGRLTNNTLLAPVRACMDYWWWRDVVVRDPFLLPEEWLPDPPPDPLNRLRIVNPEPVISILGTATSPTSVEVLSVVRLQTQRQVTNGRATELTAELLDAAGRTIAAAPVYDLRSLSHGPCGCEEASAPDGYPRLIQAFIQDVGPGAVLRIRDGGTDLWTRRASTAPPKIASFTARLSRDMIDVAWKVETDSDDLGEYWLQWSADDGETWHGLAATIRGDRFSAAATALPAGRLAIRLLASDGFHTTPSDPVSLRVPRRPPQISILSPQPGETLLAGNPMRLWGVATADNGEPVGTEDARWLVDGREAASGLDAFIEAPAVGRHKVSLMVGGEAGRADSTFQTIRTPDESGPGTGPERAPRSRRRKR
jgi:hypothetical protein